MRYWCVKASPSNGAYINSNATSYVINGMLADGEYSISNPSVIIASTILTSLHASPLNAKLVKIVFTSGIERFYDVTDVKLINDGRIRWDLTVNLPLTYRPLIISQHIHHTLDRYGGALLATEPREEDLFLPKNETIISSNELDFHGFFDDHQNYVISINGAWVATASALNTADVILPARAAEKHIPSRSLDSELFNGTATAQYIPISIGQDIANFKAYVGGEGFFSAFKGLFSDVQSAINSIRFYPLDVYTGGWGLEDNKSYYLTIGGDVNLSLTGDLSIVTGTTPTNIKCGRPIGAALGQAWIWSGELIPNPTDSSDLAPISTYSLHLPYADEPIVLDPRIVAGKVCHITLVIDYTTGRGEYQLYVTDLSPASITFNPENVNFSIKEFMNQSTFYNNDTRALAWNIYARIGCTIGIDIPIGFENGSERLRNNLMTAANVVGTVVGVGTTSTESTVVKKRNAATGRMVRAATVDKTTSTADTPLSKGVSAGTTLFKNFINNEVSTTSWESSPMLTLYDGVNGRVETKKRTGTLPSNAFYGRAIQPLYISGDDLENEPTGVYIHDSEVVIEPNMAHKIMPADEIEALSELLTTEGVIL